MITTRQTMGALLAALMVSAPADAHETTPRAVVELFTSQGCAACPPADALMGELAGRGDVVALTEPVQLWDFLGWEDTLARPQHTARQKSYAVARSGEVFTPQIVVNGLQTVVGSDRSAVESAIAATEAAISVPIALDFADDVFSISIGEGDPGPRGAKLMLLIVEEKVSVPVGGGENRGRTLTYHNVVRDMRPIAMWDGQPMELNLPLPHLDRSLDTSCVVLLQRETFEGPGAIIGVARYDGLFDARPVVSLPPDRPEQRSDGGQR